VPADRPGAQCEIRGNRAMKPKELRELSDQELVAELERLHRHLFDLRAQSVTEKLEDSSMITKAQRDIARILTIQRQRQLAAVGGQGA
jgi:large subunit ribosomal protein L29